MDQMPISDCSWSRLTLNVPGSIGIEDVLVGHIQTGILEMRDHDLQVARAMIVLNRATIDWDATKRIAELNGPDTVAALERLRSAT